MNVPVLFVRRDSIYKTMPGVDAWDIDRDALNWPGGAACVAHPPCRAWSKLSHLAKPREGEKYLAIWTMIQVRKYGGVLEHPRLSKLFAAVHAPVPPDTRTDPWGGYTLPVLQWWWGHRAEKSTWLYIVGLKRDQLPEIPYKIGVPEYVIATDRITRKRSYYRKLEVSRAEREATPPEFAKWLVEVARRCRIVEEHTLTHFSPIPEMKELEA